MFDWRVGGDDMCLIGVLVVMVCVCFPGKPRMQRILQRAVLVASGRWRGEACE